MLTSLAIRNIVLIDRLDLSFSDGFGVLTGETGAGKSILLGALGFVLGGRSAAGLLRSGEAQGSVVACFAVAGNSEMQKILEENGLHFENELIVRRVIYEDGKSKAFINDAPVGVGVLANISAKLVEIHGQHDQRGLLDSANHREILDKYAQLDSEISTVNNAYEGYNALQKELEKLEALAEKSSAEEDYLSYVLKELEQLNPREGEENDLAACRAKLMNSEKITGGISAASEILEGGRLVGVLTKTQGFLHDAAKLDPKLQAVIEALERASIEIEEANATLDNILNNLDNSGESLENIEERLFALRGSARKYRITPEELPAYLENVRQKLDAIKNSENRINEVQKKLAIEKQAFLLEAQKLSKKRKDAAIGFQHKLVAELAPLKMENTRFEVNIEQLSEAGWSRYGVDKISFMASTNPGTPFAPLVKIASGGELSRFMLAMKVVLSEIKSVPTLIFDEVDTGIGGAVADSVGRRMEMLGRSLQVLAVTHHPQVAARSNFHLKIAKEVSGGSTVTRVEEITGENKRGEIARMLAGESITSEALAAASRLMECA